MSEYVSYFPSSPDPVLPGCIATGKLEDGVVFSTILPLEPNAAYCYIGRSAITEAAALIYGMSRKDAEAALSDGSARAQKKIEQLTLDLEDLSVAYGDLKRQLAKLAGDDVK